MGAYFIRGSFAAGQSSTITGTLAGQIIMEGYLNLNSALRRITTLIAIVPAVIDDYIGRCDGKLLI
jgi:manganese transport protein